MNDKVYQIPPNEVIVSKDRHRKHFDKGASQRLRNSIKELGQLQPGICTKDEEGKIHLVAGERRLRACEEIGNSFKYLLYEEITNPFLLEVIELTENILRENLTWQEDIKAKERLHELEQKLHGATSPGVRGGHTMQDTADILGQTKGLISQDVELAYWLKHVPEVAKAKNRSEAKKVVKRIKESAKRSDALRSALKKAPPGASGSAEVKEKGKGEKTILEQRLHYLADRSILGSFEEKIGGFEDEHFDVVIFDPPWGVTLDQVSKEDGSILAYEDSPEAYQSSLKNWLEVIYGKMSLNSHLYMFFGIINHEFVYSTLETCGFTTNRMPLFWYKQGAHGTRNPEVWPGRCYEPIAYARKGGKKLALLGRPDIIPTPLPTPKIKKEHPSAKHPQVYVDLLERSCAPGDRVLDPMSGSGMFGVAAEFLTSSLQLDWWMIEKEKVFRDLSLFNLLQGYNKIVTGDFEEPILPPEKKYENWGFSLEEQREQRSGKGFKKLKPGTDDWKAYWKEHSEEQEAMLTWAKEEKEK